MSYKNFNEYLSSVCFRNNPTILDDDMPDFFDNWLSKLDQEELIDHADIYALEMSTALLGRYDEKLQEIIKDMIKDTRDLLK